MLEWAKKEIELATKDSDNLYHNKCCEGAFNAFASLLHDMGGMSSVFSTKRILDNLIKGRPLTPIENTDDVWEFLHHDLETKDTIYKCDRYGALTKIVSVNGEISYRDVSRIICSDINDPHIESRDYFVESIVGEYIKPIEFPYTPEDPIYVNIERYSTKYKEVVFDILVIHNYETNDGDQFPINRAFRKNDNGWDELTSDAYHVISTLREMDIILNRSIDKQNN